MRILNHQRRREAARLLPNLPQNRINTSMNFARSFVGMRCVLASLFLCAIPLYAADAPFTSASISGLGARNIGSAAMSGRISCIAGAHESSGKITLFVGSASGGVWKSDDSGTRYRPIFDEQPVQSIGAIALDPKNSKNVWVGTGESWTRNSVSIGDGIYKSTDGGETWSRAGLEKSERIARIAVDPRNSDTVFAAVPGALWSDSTDRGLYKTIDGGKTWQQVLKGPNLSTGCTDVAIDPSNPDTMFAAMWDFRRKGWEYRSGGAVPTAPSASGLFRSTDGGNTWTEITEQANKGFPKKPYGRLAVAIAPSKSQRVYAFVESPESALFVSDDGGATWEKRDKSQWMVWRPFYFANLIVDPKNPDRLFKPDGSLIVSEDGGKSFSVGGFQQGAHGDAHDVWIDPTNSQVVFIGDDGGMWYSYNGGSKWWKGENLPVSQFYHVSVDEKDPYQVYGGLQDNSSWVGDSQYPGGITNHRWENMYGGDGFWMFQDPADPDYIYAEAQGGEIGRVNRYTHDGRSIKPYPNYKEGKLRFNWNTPIHMSPNEKGTIYLGAQFLFRSRDHGQSWERISPDLTTNDPEKQKQEESGGITVDNSSAEMHTTIYSISESPKNGQLIWAGTDDGNVQITRDGGKTWTNVVDKISGLPKNSWVSSVKASSFNEGTAYATFDRHTFGDMKPYAYKTTDYGQTWTPLALQESGARGYAHVITEDPVDPNLLYVGTEFGLWISIDGGKQWAQYKGSNFPAVAVRDIVVHPRESDLVLATHGRGIWIIDDISPLRQLAPELMAQEAVLMPSKAVQYLNAGGGWAEGDSTFRGRSRSDDAFITYYQKRRHIFGDLKIEIFDSSGKLVDSVAGTKHRGLNRASWSMRLKPPLVPPAASAAFEAATGPRVLPGTYTVKMTKGDQVYNGKIDVLLDRRAKYNAQDRKEQYELLLKLYKMLDHMSYTVANITGVRDAAQDRAGKLPQNDALRKNLDKFAGDVDALRSKIVATKEGGAITGEIRIREYTTEVYGDVNGYDGKPTAEAVARTDALGRELEDVIKDFDQLTSKELPGINNGLKKKKMEPIQTLSQQQWDKMHPEGGGQSSGGMMRTLERD